MSPTGRHLLVFGDSLAFHGPARVEPPGEPRLFPNVCTGILGPEWSVDLVARPGSTTRDGWWALTKDPVVWGDYLPRADAVVLSLGHMDQLPAAVPTWLRETIPYIRPGAVRRRVRGCYLWAAPPLIRATGGRWSQLPTAAVDHYLGRITAGIRYMRPGLPIVRLLPSPYDAAAYPSQRPHAPAVEAGREWGRRHGVGVVELDDLVGPGPNNPDGMHWGWQTHRRVGAALAAALAAALRADGAPAAALRADGAPAAQRAFVPDGARGPVGTEAGAEAGTEAGAEGAVV